MNRRIRRALCLTLAAALLAWPAAAEPDDPAAAGQAADIPAAEADGFARYWEENQGLDFPAEETVSGEAGNSGGGAVPRQENGATVWDLPAGGYVEWPVSAPAGLYRLALTYIAHDGEENQAACAVEIGGTLPFSEADHIPLNKVWENAEGKTTDNRGNDISPRQVVAEVWNTADLNAAENITADSYYFAMPGGQITLRITARKGELTVGGFRLYNTGGLPGYAEYRENNATRPDTAREFQKKFEAEDAQYKSSSNLYPVSDRSTPAVSPSDPVKNKINVIGGDSWKSPGQWLSWKVHVPADGWYTLNFKYKQNAVRGLEIRRRLTIDGRVLFREMEDIRFSYGGGWQFCQPGGEEPYRFYLTAGDHEIRMESVLGDLTGVLTEMNRSLVQLNTLYRRIIMVTGVTPDPYHDYFLHTEIPELLDTFRQVSASLKQNAQTLEHTAGSSGSSASSLYEIVRQLDSFCAKPNSIPERLDSYKSNISVLADLLLSLKEQPLQLDYLSLSSADQGPVLEKTGFFDTVAFRFTAFLASFSADYASLGDRYDSDREPLNVWISANDLLATGVSSGRDQATVLKRFIDEQFTPTTGIAVNLNLVSTSDTLLQAIVGHKAPDVAIFVPKTLPITLAMRGGLMDLSQAPQFAEWQRRVYDSAFIPYRYDGGVYGMPETQVFNVLYYREDIFEELGLTLPDTWEEYYKAAAVIQGKNLQVGVLADQTTLEMLLLQNGRSIYNEDVSRIALSDPVAIQVFRQWTELYSQYGIPLSYDFFNRFRTGEMPMAIAPLTQFSQLSIAAPEIANVWNMAPIPATVTDNGKSRAQGCITTASVVMADSGRQEDAYRFIDWWTSGDVQAQFGNSMENLMGAAARYNTANKEAFESLPWEDGQREMLRNLWAEVSDVPQSPASYSVTRNILNAFRRVVYYNETPREVINKYAQDMDRELIRKRQEFGLE